MSYFCPQCGEPAKRYAGATEQADGMPVVCKTHGRVFVNTRTLPIWGLLTKSFTTKDSLRLAKRAALCRKWRAANPEKMRASRNKYRAAHPEWAKNKEKVAWQRTLADPERHERDKETKRAYGARNREQIREKARAVRAKKKEALNGN